MNESFWKSWQPIVFYLIGIIPTVIGLISFYRNRPRITHKVIETGYYVNHPACDGDLTCFQVQIRLDNKGEKLVTLTDAILEIKNPKQSIYAATIEGQTHVTDRGQVLEMNLPSRRIESISISGLASITPSFSFWLEAPSDGFPKKVSCTLHLEFVNFKRQSYSLEIEPTTKL